MPRNIHIQTTLAEDASLIADLGEKAVRWIYGTLWRRLCQHLEGEVSGPLREALRGEVDHMLEEAIERCADAVRSRKPRQMVDALLDERETLYQLQAWLAPPPELVADEEPSACEP